MQAANPASQTITERHVSVIIPVAFRAVSDLPAAALLVSYTIVPRGRGDWFAELSSECVTSSASHMAS